MAKPVEKKDETYNFTLYAITDTDDGAFNPPENIEELLCRAEEKADKNDMDAHDLGRLYALEHILSTPVALVQQVLDNISDSWILESQSFHQQLSVREQQDFEWGMLDAAYTFQVTRCQKIEETAVAMLQEILGDTSPTIKNTQTTEITPKNSPALTLLELAEWYKGIPEVLTGWMAASHESKYQMYLDYLEQYKELTDEEVLAEWEDELPEQSD